MSEAQPDSLREDFTGKGDPREWIELLWRIPQREDMEPKQVEIALRERIKELNCLYSIARLAERYCDSMEDFLKCLADILPLSWQYPEMACARIALKDQIFKSRKMGYLLSSSRPYMLWFWRPRPRMPLITFL